MSYLQNVEDRTTHPSLLRYDQGCRAIAIFLVLCLAVTCADAQTSKKRVKKPLTRVVKVVDGAPPPRAEPKIYGLAVEKYVSDIVVNQDGTSLQTWEIVERAKTSTSIPKLKKLERVYNKDLEDFDLTDAYILKADGSKVEIPAGAIQKKPTPQSEAAPAFSSLMMLEATFDGIAVGDAIHYRGTLRINRTHFDGQFDSIDYFAAIYDWDSIDVSLHAPVGMKIYTQAIGLDGGRVEDVGNTANWKWHKSGLKGIEYEMLMADLIGISPRVAMTTFKDFDSLGAAYWRTASKMAAVTPTIQAKAYEITKNAKTPEDQAYAIYEWVNKNIRYLSLVIDRNGWIPHSADDILANRYGDCKDYSTILYSLLKAKGIESEPVIIRADMGYWFPDVAVPGYFNHAILYIPSLDLFADATAPNTRLGMIPQQDAGKKAFLAGERTGVIETHPNRPDDSQILSKISIELTPNGDVRSHAATTFIGRGEILMRPLFGSDTAKIDAFVGTILAYYGQTGTGKIVKQSDPFKVRDPYEVDIDVELPDYTTFTTTGSFRMPVGLNLMNLFSMEDYVRLETRISDLPLGAVRFRDSITIKFPDGVEINAESLKSSNFQNDTGSYKNEYTIDGRNVTIEREIVLARDTITPDQYPAARELIQKAAEAFKGEIKYTAPATFVNEKSKLLAKSPPLKPQLGFYERMVADATARFKPLTAAEATKLEAQLLKQPDDVEAHQRLFSYYAEAPSRGKAAEKRSTEARMRHRLWMIEHHPEIGDDNLFGYRMITLKSDGPEYQTLRSAWLKQVEANKAISTIRVNAFEFLKYNEPELAVTILKDGLKLDPTNYQLPLALQKFYHGDPFRLTVETPEAKTLRYENEVEYGEVALRLLKNERSHERDRLRRYLLQDISRSAVEIDELDKAAAFARELILDFGNDSDDAGYDDATHIGNIVNGRVEFRRKNIAKAKEYLLIAIRAPLRKTSSWLSEIDTVLAKELFEAGEKDTVTEYFRLCEGLSNLTTERKLFEGQIKALKYWQQQIGKGETPSFDFYKL